MQVGDLVIPEVHLVTDDGEPMDSPWHRSQMNLLIESILHHWQDRTDYYVGGNMFVYYSIQQAEQVVRDIQEGVHRAYRGPDFFVVKGVDGQKPRKAWVVWEEDGRYPDVIVELLSPTTFREDTVRKKEIYERIFRTPEYFWYDPESDDLVGWRLRQGRYRRIRENPRGWLWSQELGLWLGRWDGEYLGEGGRWIRFYDPTGELVLIGSEAERQRAEAALRQAETERQRAEAALRQVEIERQRAEAERQRADRLEAELARLKARLAALGLEGEVASAGPEEPEGKVEEEW